MKKSDGDKKSKKPAAPARSAKTSPAAKKTTRKPPASTSARKQHVTPKAARPEQSKTEGEPRLLGWNYRVIRKIMDGRESYCIHEVYYWEDDSAAWIATPGSPYGESLKELNGDLALMAQALDRPVLDLQIVDGKEMLIPIGGKRKGKHKEAQWRPLDESLKNFSSDYMEERKQLRVETKRHLDFSDVDLGSL